MTSAPGGRRRVASVSLDLDDRWSYMKTHGDPAWQGYPSYLDRVCPRVLEFLQARGLKITFFIVGQDAAIEANRPVLRALAQAGHDIGSHSFNHDPWLHLYSEADLERELAAAETAIASATGVVPRGFRGPGFSMSDATLRVLKRRGYRYDATTFANILNPVARWYFLAHSRLDAAERERRKALFGSLADALRPIDPFLWKVGEGERLLELPVTTMPWLRLPIHMSYILYLARFSRVLARAYFSAALALCRLAGTEPSMLLHPLDFLGVEDGVGLEFFPGMDMPVRYKLAIVGETLDRLAAHYELITVGEHVTRIEARLASLDEIPLGASP
jgi:peptidoglycan/xylan/chitin deacetylase (PgdA/CDA1 family)